MPIIGDNIDSDRLLRAIKRQETTNCDCGGIRFEASWMPKGARMAIQGRIVVGTGRNYDKSPVAQERWQTWGVWSSASFGPWQMLYHKAADIGYTEAPYRLNDGGTALFWANKLLQIIDQHGAKSVRQFADEWNSGTFKDANEPEEYMSAVERYYKEDSQ